MSRTILDGLGHFAAADVHDLRAAGVEGAAGGTGHLAVEVANMMGANVIGLASSQERGEFAKKQTILVMNNSPVAAWSSFILKT